MKMSEVKVGMKLHDPGRPYLPVLTVTKLTERGFKYTHESRSMKLGNPDGIPEFGSTMGGEYFGSNGECWYEPVNGATVGKDGK